MFYDAQVRQNFLGIVTASSMCVLRPQISFYVSISAMVSFLGS